MAVKQIFRVRDEGQTLFYDSFSDVVSHLKLAHKRVRKNGFDIDIQEVDHDRPGWERLSWQEQEYYHSDIKLWRKAKYAKPPHWDEWDAMEYSDRRERYDNSFTSFLEGRGEETHYAKAA